jgi:ABC-type transporter MlaC component
MRTDESHITKRVMSMNVDGTLVEVDVRKDQCEEKDYVKNDMKIKGVSMEMSDRREWKKKACCADPT